MYSNFFDSIAAALQILMIAKIEVDIAMKNDHNTQVVKFQTRQVRNNTIRSKFRGFIIFEVFRNYPRFSTDY